MIFALTTQHQVVSSALDFRRLFESELTYVWHALRRLGVPERDRIDVAHDVFVAVHRHFADYDPARPLRPWLFGFAFRSASDYRRRARHRFELMGVDAADTIDTSARHDEASAERDLLERALERVDEEKRAVLILHDIEEHTMSEISDALGIPMPTGYSRLHAGRARLAAALRELQGGER
jgi:RNA polymerase sigma-70 factor (ECF subfamily)